MRTEHGSTVAMKGLPRRPYYAGKSLYVPYTPPAALYCGIHVQSAARDIEFYFILYSENNKIAIETLKKIYNLHVEKYGADDGTISFTEIKPLDELTRPLFLSDYQVMGSDMDLKYLKKYYKYYYKNNANTTNENVDIFQFKDVFDGASFLDFCF